jgi:hypothetical protein
MEASDSYRPAIHSAAWTILIIVAAYLCAYSIYRIFGSAEADYGFSRRTKSLVTTTDPATGKTSTKMLTSIVCGYGPPRMRTDTGTSDKRFMAALFWPALKAEEAMRRLVYRWQWS